MFADSANILGDILRDESLLRLNVQIDSEKGTLGAEGVLTLSDARQPEVTSTGSGLFCILGQ